MQTSVSFINDTSTPYIPAFKYNSAIGNLLGYKYNGYYFPTASFPPGSTDPPATAIPSILPQSTGMFVVTSNCCDSNNESNLNKPCVSGCQGCHLSDLTCNQMFLLSEDMTKTIGPLNVPAKTQTTINASQFFLNTSPWSPFGPSDKTSPWSPLSSSDPNSPLSTPRPVPVIPLKYTGGIIVTKVWLYVIIAVVVLLLVLFLMRSRLK